VKTTNSIIQQKSATKMTLREIERKSSPSLSKPEETAVSIVAAMASFVDPDGMLID
jgi:hypothetical protein